MKRSILRLELGGVAFTVGLGSALHFAFEWSGRVISIDPIALAILGILFVLLTLCTPQLLVFMTPSPQAVVLWNSTEKDMNLAHGTTLRIASFPALSRWVLLLAKVMIKISSG